MRHGFHHGSIEQIVDSNFLVSVGWRVIHEKVGKVTSSPKDLSFEVVIVELIIDLLPLALLVAEYSVVIQTIRVVRIRESLDSGHEGVVFGH